MDFSTVLTQSTRAAGGVQASGEIIFSGQPLNTETITVNGVAFEFITNGTGPGTAVQIEIGLTVDATVLEAASKLNASVHADVDDASYTPNTTSDEVEVVFDVGGTAGNSFTLAQSATNVTVSAGALAGGTAAGAGGTLNPVGTSTGAVLVARHNDTFEDRCVALIGAIEFCQATIANPTTSDATLAQAKQLRRVIREVLAKMAMALNVSTGDTDDRVTMAARVRAAGVAAFNTHNRPTGL